MFRRIMIAITFAGLVLGATGTAGAGVVSDDYTPSPGITVDDNNVTPGSTVTISGSGCGPGQPITITFLGDTVASTTTAADGSFSSTLAVPDSTAPGTYTVSAVGCGVEVLGISLTVRAAGTPDPGGSGSGSGSGSGQLPRTGDETTTLARAGVLLVAIGAFAAFVARRRTTRTRRS